jgi:hypothetical protein
LSFALLAVACKTERTVLETRQELDPIRQKFAGNYQLERDASGMVSVKSERRSSFESKVYSADKTARTGGAYKTGKFATKDYQSKDFAGQKSFRTKSAAEGTRKSPWNKFWKNQKSSAREDGKDYDAGDAFPTSGSKENDRSFSTDGEPYSPSRLRYKDSALENIRSPEAGEGSGPSIRDVRGMLGKDD